MLFSNRFSTGAVDFAENTVVFGFFDMVTLYRQGLNEHSMAAGELIATAAAALGMTETVFVRESTAWSHQHGREGFKKRTSLTAYLRDRGTKTDADLALYVLSFLQSSKIQDEAHNMAAQQMCRDVLQTSKALRERYHRQHPARGDAEGRLNAYCGAYAIVREETSNNALIQELLVVEVVDQATTIATHVSKLAVYRGTAQLANHCLAVDMIGFRPQHVVDLLKMMLITDNPAERRILGGTLMGLQTTSLFPILMPIIAIRLDLDLDLDAAAIRHLTDSHLLKQFNTVQAPGPALVAKFGDLTRFGISGVETRKLPQLVVGSNNAAIAKLNGTFGDTSELVSPALLNFCKAVLAV